MSTAAAASAPQENLSARSWEKIGNAVVLLLYSGVVLFTVRYHEKWADEAQAWLIARDLDLKTIWFHELKYEGSPGLWHTILWIAQHWLHAPYATLGYIGVLFAIVGVAVLIYKAPFPWYIRWPLAFTYVMVYQYAVIARPYTLLPLLCFLVAIFFKDVQHPVRMTVVLVLLANLSLHGTILAGCFGLLYLVEAIKSWPRMDEKLRNRYFICAAVMMLVLLFIFLILKPTSDVAEFRPPDGYLAVIIKPTHWQKLISAIAGAFSHHPIPSALFLLFAGAWCLTRHRLALFVIPMLPLVVLYTFIHGYAHHQGAVFVAAITSIWIAWPTMQEQRTLGVRQLWYLRGMALVLAIMIALNIWDSAVVIDREYRYPYSGAEDAAQYLKSVGADRQVIFGYLFGVVGVQAYFDHNIFANLPTAYFHLGAPFRGSKLDVDELRRRNPEYIVAYSDSPQIMMDTDGPVWTSLGYKLVHFSDGYYLYRNLVYERESYFIYRRVHPTDEQTPQTLSPDKQAGSGDRR
jgi:hypothetical protein